MLLTAPTAAPPAFAALPAGGGGGGGVGDMGWTASRPFAFTPLTVLTPSTLFTPGAAWTAVAFTVAGSTFLTLSTASCFTPFTPSMVAVGAGCCAIATAIHRSRSEKEISRFIGVIFG